MILVQISFVMLLKIYLSLFTGYRLFIVIYKHSLKKIDYLKVCTGGPSKMVYIYVYVL